MLGRTRLTTVLMCAVFLFALYFASPSAAQAEPSQQDEGQPKTIFSYKKEVGLTDDQENKIKAILFDDQSSMNSDRNKLQELGAELSEMIKEKKDIKLIKNKLTEISKIQVEVTCRDIESGRKINNVLTPEQLKKWDDIKKAFAQTRK